MGRVVLPTARGALATRLRLLPEAPPETCLTPEGIHALNEQEEGEEELGEVVEDGDEQQDRFQGHDEAPSEGEEGGRCGGVHDAWCCQAAPVAPAASCQ